MSSDLVWFLMGAFCSAALILFVQRHRPAADAHVHQSLGEVRALLDAVHRQQDEITSQATQFTQLLGRASDRGRWGELTLQRIVEASGLREHVDFDVQVHAGDQDGVGRPDLVIRLPTGGCLPVDSKAVWSHYEAVLGETGPDQRATKLAQHARDVRDAVATLSAKRYWALFAQAPEMVVLFMPSEAAFAAASAQDPDLLAHAIERRVVITTPSTLFALLQVVAVGWQQAELSKNAEEIRRLGAQLTKRLIAVGQHLSKTSRGLDSAVRAHNEVVAAFDGGLLSTARRMGELGAGSTDIAMPALAEVAVRELAVAPGEDSAPAER